MEYCIIVIVKSPGNFPDFLFWKILCYNIDIKILKYNDMKILIGKIFRAIGSRMTYLIIGLSFSVVVIAVNAAIPWTNVPTRSSGQTLTSTDWNAMKTDLDSLRTAVDGAASGFTTCMTKVSTSNSYNPAGDGRFWATVNCDPGWTMTGGGCMVNDGCWSRLLAQSYPTVNGWACAQQTSMCDSLGPYTYVRCCR